MPRRSFSPSGSPRVLAVSLLALSLAGSSVVAQDEGGGGQTPQATQPSGGNEQTGTGGSEQRQDQGGGNQGNGLSQDQKTAITAVSVAAGVAAGLTASMSFGSVAGLAAGMAAGMGVYAGLSALASGNAAAAAGAARAGGAGAATAGEAKPGGPGDSTAGEGEAIAGDMAGLGPDQQQVVAQGAEGVQTSLGNLAQAAQSGNAEAAQAARAGLQAGMDQIAQASPEVAQHVRNIVDEAARNNQVTAGRSGTPEQRRANAELMRGFAETFPEDGALRAKFAESLLAAENYPDAVREAARAAASNPEAYSTMARAQYHMGDYASARGSARAALKFDPHDAYSGSVLRLTDGRDGPRDGSSADMVRTAASGVGPRPGASSFGSLAPSRAPSAARYAGSRGSSGADSSLLLIQNAQRLLKHGDSAGALKAAESALRLDPSNDTARYYMVMALTQQKRLAEALKAADQAVAKSPQDPRFLTARSRIYNMLGRHAEALADAEAALKLRPDDAEALVGEAWALDALGRRAEALAALAAAAALDPKYRDLSAKAPYMKPGELAQALAGETEAWEQAFPAKRAPEQRRFPAGALVTAVGVLLILAGFASRFLPRRRKTLPPDLSL